MEAPLTQKNEVQIRKAATTISSILVCGLDDKKKSAKQCFESLFFLLNAQKSLDAIQ